jgi:hypothetical protein
MMSLCFRQNLELRQTLVQKLGLDSKFLHSCLVRSEALLHEREYQTPLRLVRHLAVEDDYESVLDFLLGLFVPAIKPRIFAYYHGDGPRLMAQSSWIDIDQLDRMMVTALKELHGLYGEIRSAAWQVGRGDFTVPELTAAWLDLYVAPRFTVPGVVAGDDAQERNVA